VGKRSKTRNEQRGCRPPLSLLDKFVYYVAIILSFVLSLIVVFLIRDIWSYIAFRDAFVIAYQNRASFLFILPILLYMEMSSLIFFITTLESKKPIFGNRKVKYGEAPWRKDYFPLFDPRRKKLYIKPSEKRFRRKIWTIWLVGLLICLLLAPLGLFGRDCLMDDNRVISYNMLNRQKSVAYTTDDYAQLTIIARFVSGYRSSDYWTYEICISMDDGKAFTFSDRDFDSNIADETERSLKKMLQIKSYFEADQISIKGAEHIDDVADYHNMNDHQKQLLLKLFQ
jgi:hypothetical protein